MKSSKRFFNILVIDSAVYPLYYGYMQEIFGRCFPERGHKVTWLLQTKSSATYGESRQLNETEVILIPGRPSTGYWTSFDNSLKYTKGLSQLLPYIVTNHSIDVIFCRNYVQSAIAAYRVSKRFNIPFVYYLGFPLFEAKQLSARRRHRKDRVIIEILSFLGISLRNWITRRADFVFTMSDYWAKQVIEDLGVSQDRIQSLPAGFDASINPEAVDGTKIRDQFNLSDHPTLFYMGTITPPRDVPIMADILAKVVQQIPEAELLLLYGNGEEKQVPVLRRKFAEKGVEKNVIFAPTVRYDQVPAYIAASHVGLSPFETIPLYMTGSAYKFIEMLGMACPVVASNTPEQESILRRTKAGICVPYKADAFAEAVVYILTHPEEAREMGRRGRDFVLKERSYDVLTDRVEEVFQRLVVRRYGP